MQRIKFDYEQSIEFLHHLIEHPDYQPYLDTKKDSVVVLDDAAEKLLSFRYPISFPPVMKEDELVDFVEKIPEEPMPHIILLVQAGSAALGYVEEGEVLFHKVIKKYMTRKKRGKAQISYLNSKGKSKAGSRIRLANTVSFFEDINEKLYEWDFSMEEEKMILYSCPARLWGLLFASKVEPPFTKDSPYLRKVSRDVNTPTFEELLRTERFAHYGFLHLFQDIELDFDLPEEGIER